MLAPAVAAAKPAPLGRWGERLDLAPDFALTQERRAPKFPDVERRLAELGPSQVDALDQGLLLCHAQIAGDSLWNPDHHAPRWDLFGGPDTRFRLTVGAAHPIELWGPEDHWNSYVSIPRLSLKRGDRLQLEVWDRDVTSDQKIGRAELRWEGALPIEWQGRWFNLTCNAVDAEGARRLAEPMLETIDRELDGMERAEPDAAKIAFGEVDEDARFLRGMFKEGWTSRSRRYPLRYAAGAIGWESPELQARIGRLHTALGRWHERCAAKVAELFAAAPQPGSWQRLGGREARVIELACGRDATRRLGDKAATTDADCVAELELRDAAGPPRAADDGCLGPRPSLVGAYRVDGSYSSAWVFARAGGKVVDCRDAPGAERALIAMARGRGGEYSFAIPRHAPPPPAPRLVYLEGITGPASWLALPATGSPRPAPPPAPPPPDTADRPPPAP